jgi:anti-anti-sigma regulatory factor
MANPRGKEIVCDVGSLTGPDLGTVDALARLALTLRRLGHELRLRDATSELRELLALTGLLDLLIVEPGGEAEEWEQRLGVEEEGHLDDPPA